MSMAFRMEQSSHRRVRCYSQTEQGHSRLTRRGHSSTADRRCSNKNTCPSMPASSDSVMLSTWQFCETTWKQCCHYCVEPHERKSACIKKKTVWKLVIGGGNILFNLYHAVMPGCHKRCGMWHILRKTRPCWNALKCNMRFRRLSQQNTTTVCRT